MLLTPTQARIVIDAMALLGTIDAKLSTMVGVVEVTHYHRNGKVGVINHHTGEREDYDSADAFMQAYIV